MRCNPSQYSSRLAKRTVRIDLCRVRHTSVTSDGAQSRGVSESWRGGDDTVCNLMVESLVISKERDDLIQDGEIGRLGMV